MRNQCSCDQQITIRKFRQEREIYIDVGIQFDGLRITIMFLILMTLNINLYIFHCCQISNVPSIGQAIFVHQTLTKLLYLMTPVLLENARFRTWLIFRCSPK